MNHSSSSPSNQKFGVGIDFGTSNSAAAIFDGKKVSLIPLETETTIMPSASYLDKRFVTTTGQAGINLYIASNRGRKVELSAQVLGEGRTSTGQINTDTNLPDTAPTNLFYGQSFNDASLPGRLFRGTKRLLGLAGNERLLIFDRPFRLVALITPILLRIRHAIENSFSIPVSKACIGHPVNFEGREQQRNVQALNILSESYQHAGIKNQTFYPEPLAATLSFLYSNPQRKHSSQRILTVDFGGGTLDLSILHDNNQSYEIEAIHGIGLGGDRIDQTVFRQLIFPLIGEGERWCRIIDGCTVDTLFPFIDYEDFLINWPISYMLNQNKYTSPILERISQKDSSTHKYKRLYSLITQNYCYQVFQAIKDLKAELSYQTSATLDIPEIDIEITVQRASFEKMIEGLLEEFRESIDHTLAKANLQASDIDIVIRTGGSSLIPAVRAILDKKFPGKVVEHDPFTSVAAGLAIADYQGKGNKIPL